VDGTSMFCTENPLEVYRVPVFPGRGRAWAVPHGSRGTRWEYSPQVLLHKGISCQQLPRFNALFVLLLIRKLGEPFAWSWGAPQLAAT
jgi:hypothetical protein